MPGLRIRIIKNDLNVVVALLVVKDWNKGEMLLYVSRFQHPGIISKMEELNTPERFPNQRVDVSEAGDSELGVVTFFITHRYNFNCAFTDLGTILSKWVLDNPGKSHDPHLFIREIEFAGETAALLVVVGSGIGESGRVIVHISRRMLPWVDSHIADELLQLRHPNTLLYADDREVATYALTNRSILGAILEFPDFLDSWLATDTRE